MSGRWCGNCGKPVEAQMLGMICTCAKHPSASQQSIITVEITGDMLPTTLPPAELDRMADDFMSVLGDMPSHTRATMRQMVRAFIQERWDALRRSLSGGKT